MLFSYIFRKSNIYLVQIYQKQTNLKNTTSSPNCQHHHLNNSKTMATLSIDSSIHLTHSLPSLLKTPKCISNTLVNFPLNNLKKPILSSSLYSPGVSYNTPKALSVKTSGSENDVSDGKKKTNPIVVIDNYDSFTYNLCQVLFLEPLFHFSTSIMFVF